MRPRGEVRRAVEGCIPLDAKDAVTWRDVAAALHQREVINIDAPAEVKLVRKTVENMAMAAQVKKVGSRAVPGSRRAMSTYARANGWMSGAGGAELGSVMHCWVTAF
jgi:hypothetical protein